MLLFSLSCLEVGEKITAIFYPAVYIHQAQHCVGLYNQCNISFVLLLFFQLYVLNNFPILNYTFNYQSEAII